MIRWSDPSPLTQAQPKSDWRLGMEMPTARKDIANSVVSLDDKIYVIGGNSSDGFMSDKVEVYSPTADTWETVAPLPVPVWRTSAAVMNGKIYVFGGYLALAPFPYNPTARVFEYDPAANSWIEKQAMPTARGGPVAVAYNNRIHVMGGATNNSLPTHEIYNPAANSWSSGAPMPQSRSALTGDVVGNQIFVAGGFKIRLGDAIPYDELLRYDPGSNSWADPDALAPVPQARFGMDSGSLDGLFYLFGGKQLGSGESLTLRYDPQSNLWEELEQMPEALSFMGVDRVGENFYVVGGGRINLNLKDGVATNRIFAPYGLPVSEGLINAGHSGAWFNPDTSGQGQFIDVVPENQTMFVSWFTYTDAASANPTEQRWLTALGNYSGNSAVLDLYETLGGKFDDPQAVNTNKVGEVTVSFSNCELGQMAYDIPAENLHGVFPMQRVVAGSGNVCEDRSVIAIEAVDINAGMDGAWFDPATSGQGFFIDSHPDPVGGHLIFVSWFTYGNNTASGQRWLTALGSFDGSVADLDVYETTGGSFDDPQAPSTTKVGTMSIDFTDCNNAQLNYSLPADPATGDIAITRVIAGAQALCAELAK